MNFIAEWGSHSDEWGADFANFPVISLLSGNLRRRRVRSGLCRQPPTGVSPREFRVPTEVPTFPEVRGKGPGLSPRILEESHGKAANLAASLCSMIFQYPKIGSGPSRDGLRFRRDRFEPAISLNSWLVRPRALAVWRHDRHRSARDPANPWAAGVCGCTTQRRTSTLLSGSS